MKKDVAVGMELRKPNPGQDAWSYPGRKFIIRKKQGYERENMICITERPLHPDGITTLPTSPRQSPGGVLSFPSLHSCPTHSTAQCLAVFARRTCFLSCCSPIHLFTSKLLANSLAHGLIPPSIHFIRFWPCDQSQATHVDCYRVCYISTRDIVRGASAVYEPKRGMHTLSSSITHTTGTRAQNVRNRGREGQQGDGVLHSGHIAAR